MALGHRGTFWNGRNFLYLDGGSGDETMSISQDPGKRPRRGHALLTGNVI